MAIKRASPERHGGEIDFKAVEARFLALNKARLERVRDSLRERQHDFLDILPLLFHLNHPLLPGFVSKETLAGLAGYEPGRRSLEVARRLVRSFHYRKRTLREPPLLALYLMGSVGTIAYSDESDLDIWLCHQPNLAETDLAQLQRKANGIEHWAAELGLEVHFFLIDVERFRSGEVEALSDESSGSAQHNLLLEEFYRTAVLLAGQPPLWWLVPPEHEGEYSEYVADLQKKRFIHARDHIDFGGLEHVPAEEFFGAALWQLYKGIDSPYKAALKLLLIEAYANEYPQIDLLSLDFKRAVYAGENGVDRLDPYLMMLDKVEAYLAEQGDRQRSELARRCFYLKVGERMGEEVSARRHNWRRELLGELIKAWGWHLPDLMLMDSRGSWKVHRVAEERRLMFEALSSSYRFLSEFARRYAGLSLLSQRDLNILGRKLFAAFERKAGKVDLLNRGIAADLWEERVSVHEVVGEDQRSSWLLYRDRVTAEELPANTPIKRARTILELIAWCYFNGVVDRHTAVIVYPKVSQFTANEFKLVVERMTAPFPPGCLDEGSMEEFAGPARLTQAGLFINTGLDVFTAANIGRTVATGRTDALSYGSTKKNLVQSMDMVLVTNWHEVLTTHAVQGRGLMESLSEYFKWAPPSKGEPPPRPQVCSVITQQGRNVARRIEELLRDMVATFYGAGVDPAARYLLAVERGYGVFYFEEDVPRYEAFDNYAALLRYLGRPQSRFRALVVDRHALDDTVLPLIYQRNKANTVQFFYRQLEGEVEVYVLDERGSLFHQHLPFYDGTALLNQYSRFFESSLNRINFLMQEGQVNAGVEGVEFYRITGTGDAASLRLERQSPAFQSPSKEYFSLQVIVDVSGDGKTVFNLYCGDREFSTLEHGKGLFNAVVRHVLELRQSGQGYPIYITDISMSRPVLGDEGAGKVQTIHFLTYKRRIEEELNRVMQEAD